MKKIGKIFSMDLSKYVLIELFSIYVFKNKFSKNWNENYFIFKIYNN